jgi:hypothetical protein
VKPAPRPRARLLLAGRFLASRASLLALPSGPVTGLDLSTGDIVGLAFGPGAGDAAVIADRITRWNELAQPTVRDLHWHRGRPLVSFDPAPPGTFAPCYELAPGDVVARAAELGELLDRAGLGLECGPADLALGPDGPYLRRPAIWSPDPARPLACQLAERASRLVERAPAPTAATTHVEPRRARALGRCVPGTRPSRIALVVASALLSALVASTLVGSSHGGSVAAAAPPPSPPSALAARPAVAPRHVTARVRAVRPISRGGPARVLLLAPGPVPPPPVAPTPSPTPTPVPVPVPVRTERPAREAPTRGWVEGLFVGS